MYSKLMSSPSHAVICKCIPVVFFSNSYQIGYFYLDIARYFS